ncbi:MAG TPA: recombinase family protein [Ktedonobacterales bacterium]
MPDDETRLRHVDQDSIGDEDQRDTLSAAWDEWLVHHPDQRADWDTEPRDDRLRALEAQHVQLPRPFTSESVIANPAWYRRIYGILGMTNEQFDTLLHLHRFAIAQKEAQRLAKEQERGGRGRARQKRPSAAIYLQGFSYQPDYLIESLEIQERACRAYCKRMGYKVHKVYRAMTPPPDNVPLHLEIGITPGHAFEYYRSESDHPYHVMHNLLYARTIDLIVEFTESGPSHSRFGASLADESSRLLHVEVASLWEIEPPTEDERRLDEVLTQLSHAETEEERAPLLNELRVLSKRVEKAERKTTTRMVAPTQAVAKGAPEKPKLCYTCRLQPAREGSAFCSDTCAQVAAERYVQSTTGGWCGVCGTWVGSEGCPHAK